MPVDHGRAHTVKVGAESIVHNSPSDWYDAGMKSRIATLPLPSGRLIPVLGQGTWRVGENRGKRQSEMAALRLGLDLGLSLIDTAEMYSDGAAEELIGEAIAGRREEVFLVSKVYPHNATERGTAAACERSLRRLKTDHLDLYLLHWRGAAPMAETLAAFQSLKKAGKILDYGVSNFDMDDMKEADRLPDGKAIATNQVLYNLVHRGIEWDLLPWCSGRGIPIMAYSPLDYSPSAHTGMLNAPSLRAIASRHETTPAQAALAWLLQQQVVVIPKASNAEHVRENHGALAIRLSARDLPELDTAFPPPLEKVSLEMR